MLTEVPTQANVRTADDIEAAANENEALAAAIELQSQLDQADSLEQACHDLAARLKKILGAGRVIVAWRSSENAAMQQMADVGVDDFTFEDDGYHQGQHTDAMIRAAAEEVAVCNGTLIWTAGQGIDRRGATMAVAQLATAVADQAMVAGCLIDSDGVPRGALMVVDASAANAQAFVNAIGPVIAGKLAAIQRMQPGSVELAWRNLKASVLASTRFRSSMIAVAGFAVLMMAPVTYTISTPFELQPVTRRFVAAPVDGPLKKCLVRPGDVVTEGELLAEIDPLDLDYELAGVRSELDQAVQSRKSRIAEHDFAAGQLAELETQRLRYQTEMLGQQRDRLELRSPIDGMVVSGDWRSSEGMPLSRGKTLFEVAPLDEMIVELWIPESEYHHVRQGMTIQFATHAQPDNKLTGTIARVYPKAELREHDNVFLAEVRATNSDGRLQPGMRGHATVYSDRHTIGWNWLHRPWHAARSAMGW
ncbi:efflux RND transporter periplasmic adaptor subunit [Neorhodopirellula lusitana]|uniref:efflux RND transporter periplasmic adaptor subunit n=1 Tax=Neorhodopirellula lusitana TaxID=445327 RepID=UPI00384C9AEE